MGLNLPELFSTPLVVNGIYADFPIAKDPKAASSPNSTQPHPKVDPSPFVDRKNLVYCIKDRGWRTTWRRVWVDAVGNTHRAWSRLNTYQTERNIALGHIIEEPVWQRPYAVSEGL